MNIRGDGLTIQSPTATAGRNGDWLTPELYVSSLIAQIGLSQSFWHHFACTVNWYEGLDRSAPHPRGPPAVCSLRTALLQYTTGYGFDYLNSTRKQGRRGSLLGEQSSAGGTVFLFLSLSANDKMFVSVFF